MFQEIHGKYKKAYIENMLFISKYLSYTSMTSKEFLYLKIVLNEA